MYNCTTWKDINRLCNNSPVGWWILVGGAVVGVTGVEDWANVKKPVCPTAS